MYRRPARPPAGDDVLHPGHPRDRGVRLAAPFAWVMGNRVVARDRRQRGQLGGRTTANAGRICGIVGTRHPRPACCSSPSSWSFIVRHRSRRHRQRADQSPMGRTRPTCAPAPPADRRRSADARGAHLLPPRQPVHADAGRGVGGAPRALGDPRRGCRPSGLLARSWFGARGAADRGDRLGRGRGDRGARAGAAGVRRAGASRSGGPAWPTRCGGSPRPAPTTCGCAASTRCGPSSTCSRPARARRAVDASSPTRGPSSATTSAGSSPRRSPRWPPAGSRRAGPGGWPRTGPTTPTRCVEVLDAEPALEGGVVPRWEERPLTRFERKGVAAGRHITDLAYRRVAPGLVRISSRASSSST